LGEHRKTLWLAGAIFAVAALFSVGQKHPDEYYQVIGFAAYKLGISPAANQPWELAAQIRPALQPAIVIGLVRLAGRVGLTNPFVLSTLLRFLSAALSLGAIALFTAAFAPRIGDRVLRRWLVGLSFFSWPVVFNAVRFSSENWSGKLLLLGFGLLFLERFEKRVANRFLIGVVLGLAFWMRFQVGFAIAGVWLWLVVIERERPALLASLSAGIVVSALLGVAVDTWFYGHLVLTPWTYFSENILAGKASLFGREPWSFYLTIAALLPFGPLYVAATLWLPFARAKDALTWLLVPFVVGHQLVAHKELRFMLPLLGFMPLAIVYLLEALKQRSAWAWLTGPGVASRAAWWINGALVAVVVLAPASAQLPLCKKIYDTYRGPARFYALQPYGHILDFYKRPDLQVVIVDGPEQAKCAAGETCLLALTCGQIRKLGPQKGRVVFENCPDWIYQLDYGGWLEGTALFDVYELAP
jgi:hypothetical protein